MNPKTLKALNASIAHWERIVKQNPDTPKLELDHIGISECALCKMFNTYDGCDGCPVKGTTGEDFCNGTPYPECEAFQELMGGGGDDYLFNPQFKLAALRELKFLKSLLPKKPSKSKQTK